MAAPGGIGREDPKLGGSSEAEAPVERAIAEQGVERLPGRVRRAQHGMHERVPDAAALAVGQHADRAQAQRGRVVDEASGAHDVTDHGIVGHGDQ